MKPKKRLTKREKRRRAFLIDLISSCFASIVVSIPTAYLFAMGLKGPEFWHTFWIAYGCSFVGFMLYSVLTYDEKQSNQVAHLPSIGLGTCVSLFLIFMSKINKSK